MPRRTGSPRIHLLALLTLLFLSACFPTAVNPLTEPDKAKTDDRLTGTWRCDQAKEVVFWFISAPSPLDMPTGVVELSMVRVGPDGHVTAREDRLTLFASKIGDHSYLNMTLPQLAAKQTDSSYLFFRYLVQGDRLIVHRMASEPIRKAIQAGTLKGELRGSLITINDSTENLNRFVKKGNATELFPETEKLVFQRVKNR